jgi:hypothetical protein
MSVQYSMGDDSSLTEPIGLNRMNSNASFSSGIDARVLSQATSQATIAAKSILSSGGTEQTALKTAKAAAQGVLLGSEGDLGNGPKAMMKRRKIRKQAEVVASMALVSASNSHRSGTEWDLLSNTENQMDHRLQLMQVQYDMNSLPGVGVVSRSQIDGQHNSFDNRSIVSSGQKSLSSRSIGRPPMPVPGRAQCLPNPLLSSARFPSKIEEQPSASNRSEATSEEESEEESITRRVAIRVETTRKTPKAEDHAPVSRSVGPKSTTIESGLIGDDPIYFMDSSQANKGGDRYNFDIDSDSDSGVSDDMTTPSQKTTDRNSFMGGTFDPFMASLAHAFQCGESPAPIDDPSVDQPRSSTRSTPTKKNVTKSPAKGVEARQPSLSSCSSVESDELFRDLKSYDEYALSDESEVSYDRPRQGRSLREKMKAISRRGEKARRHAPPIGSQSEEDDQVLQSDDSEESEESYEQKKRSKTISKLAKPWKMLKGVSRKANKGANPYE